MKLMHRALIAFSLFSCSTEAPSPGSPPSSPKSDGFEFEAVIDPVARTMSFTGFAGSARGLDPSTVIQDGVAGSGPANSFELVTTMVATDVDGTGACGAPASFCGEVALRSFFPSALNTLVQITSITPAAGHAPLNSDPPTGGFDNAFGLWTYGDLAGMSNVSSRLWVFGDDGTAFRIVGRVIADAPTEADFDTADTGYTLTNFIGVPSQILSGGSTGSFIRLAHNGLNDTVNEIAFDRTFSGPSNFINIDFDFTITSGGCPADGFGIALLPTAIGDVWSTSGGGPGVSEEPALAETIAVGFDIFDNGEPGGDNHVSLYYDGTLVTEAAAPFNLDNFLPNHANIFILSMGGSTSLVTVTLTEFSSMPQQVFQTLINAAPYESRLAITARTGGCTAGFDFDNVLVRYTL